MDAARWEQDRDRAVLDDATDKSRYSKIQPQSQARMPMTLLVELSGNKEGQDVDSRPRSKRTKSLTRLDCIVNSELRCDEGEGVCLLQLICRYLSTSRSVVAWDKLETVMVFCAARTSVWALHCTSINGASLPPSCVTSIFGLSLPPDSIPLPAKTPRCQTWKGPSFHSSTRYPNSILSGGTSGVVVSGGSASPPSSLSAPLSPRGRRDRHYYQTGTYACLLPRAPGTVRCINGFQNPVWDRTVFLCRIDLLSKASVVNISIYRVYVIIGFILFDRPNLGKYINIFFIYIYALYIKIYKYKEIYIF